MSAEKLVSMLLRASDAIEALDGTNAENEKLVDDYRTWRAEVEVVISDAELDAAIHAADRYARDYDRHEFGLPTHNEEHMARMRKAMRAAITLSKVSKP